MSVYKKSQHYRGIESPSPPRKLIINNNNINKINLTKTGHLGCCKLNCKECPQHCFHYAEYVGFFSSGLLSKSELRCITEQDFKFLT